MGLADTKYSQQVKTVDLMSCAGYKKKLAHTRFLPNKGSDFYKEELSTT